MKSKIKSFYSSILHAYSKISKNVIWLIILFLVTAISQFVLFALITRSLGKEYMGLWAIVIASTSIGQISSFGFSNGLIRFLPELVLKNENSKILKLVGTINLCNIVLSIPVLFFLYFLVQLYGHQLLDENKFKLFNTLTIWSMTGVFINNLFSVYVCLFDGFQKFYTRCAIQISGWILFLTLVFILLPKYQLTGVAIAFLIQGLWQLIIGIILAAKQKIIRKGFIIGFDKTSFKIISSFGIKSQSISVMVMFFDPLIKFFITKRLGLSGTVYYELANKLTIQSRNLIVNTNLVIVPKMVIENNNGVAEEYFQNVTAKNTYISVFLGLMMLIFAPLAIYIFTNQFDQHLMSIIAIINVGWICNVITSIHYHSCTALDKLNRIIIVHFIYAASAFFTFELMKYFHINGFLYYIVPALSLFLGSIYNSFVLIRFKSSFEWLYNKVFILFIITSALISINAFYNYTNMYFILFPAIIVFSVLVWRKKIFHYSITIN